MATPTLIDMPDPPSNPDTPTVSNLVLQHSTLELAEEYAYSDLSGERRPLARRIPQLPHSLLCQLQPLKMAIEAPPSLILAMATTTLRPAIPSRLNAQIVSPGSRASKEYLQSVHRIPTPAQQLLDRPT